MKALWQIILAILWRLRPVQALEVNLSDIIQIGLSMFADDEEVEDLSQDPAYRQTIAAALADAHRKLDLLIYLRACELTGTRGRAKDFQPNYTHTNNSTDVIALWRSLHRLVARFDTYERSAAKRAERLKREANNPPYGGPLRLDATHQSTSPGSAGGGLHDYALSPPSRETRGRWIARSRAQDGGGCASSRGCLRTRGPPFSTRLPIADCRLPRAPAREIAPARPIQPLATHVHTAPKGRDTMRFAIACLAATALAGCATAQPAATPSLAGKWIVDLSTKPSEPYTKAMELNLAADGSVTGSFYDSEIQAGRWKTDRGRTCVSFRTTDGAGPYHSAACLTGASVQGQTSSAASVQGQTWAEHRNFLFNWNAVRAE